MPCISLCSIFYIQSDCTSWKNRDYPSGSGDYEFIGTDTARLNEVKGILSSCYKKQYVIQAKLATGTNIYETAAQALADTGNDITFRYRALSDPDFTNSGVFCENKVNRERCKNFVVRYCCIFPVSSANLFLYVL